MSDTPVRSIGEQIRRNAVALISLLVALIALSYNTWRNETSEVQRNLRHAAFLLIEHSGNLQAIVNAQVYTDADQAWVEGWGEVLTIKTLGTLLPEHVEVQTDALFDLWQSEFEQLTGDPSERQAADAAIFQQIQQVNAATLNAIRSLD